MSKQKVYIIDGYNVIRAGNLYGSVGLSDWNCDFYNAARDKLINDIATFVESSDIAYVIFDGANNEFSNGVPQKIGRVNVVFSRFGYDADSEVIRLAIKHRGKNTSVFVVTSDASIQYSTMGEGVTRMSAGDFCREVVSANDINFQDEIMDNKPHSNQLGKMIGDDVMQKLIAIRDGLD